MNIGAGDPHGRFVDSQVARAGFRASAEISRKNYHRAERAMPLQDATRSYDSGDFNAHMKRAMEIANWKEFPKRV